MAKRVFLATRNLMFRAKLGSAVAAAGGEVTRDEAACDLIVLELADAAAAGRVAELVRRGMTVLAYGSHIQPECCAPPAPPGRRRCRTPKWNGTCASS